jgi:hypothetical protein
MFRGDAHPGKLAEAGPDYLIGDIRRLMEIVAV